MECTKNLFKETIEEMTGFTDTQLDTLKNLSPHTRRKLKSAIMDALDSMGLLLEMSIAPSFSMSTLPIYLLRAQHLMNLLTKDMENLKPESESMNDSFEVFKQGLAAVVSNIPAKVMRCIQPE
ncbi:hypothetical protein L5515_004646 [Caenorhabditis briggsae]|uniref:Uncharacterized protein n=1 Tax=Caenorhabditis briggsae TaxID=6238 RepID=A0AAE9JC69_CAEBR|nr:hypothetical protein L3Y34_001806 [Caenorhabditis briggsae]UMM24384.1 hypothetical protein L5515_004646 [Caenorhabditis briggsae]